MQTRFLKRLPRTLGLVVAAACVAFPLSGLYHAEADEPIRIYVFAGQSNMVGAATSSAELRALDPSAAARTDDVEFWGPTTDEPRRWTPLEAPTEILQPSSHNGFGPEIGASQMLVRRHPKATIAIVKLAFNGTSLHWHWNSARPDGLYQALVGRVRYARSILSETTDRPTTLAGFFWMQGESDANHRDQALAYGKLLTTFIKALRTDLAAPKLPVVIGRIQDLRHVSSRFGRYSDVVRREQAAVARNTPNVFAVSTDGLERDTLSPIHFSSRGTLDLGRRFVRTSFPL
jgi:hypothetical protein